MDLESEARALYAAALQAVEPAAATARYLGREGSAARIGDVELGARGRLVVAGAGKAGAAMAESVEAVLGERIDAGVVAIPAGRTAATTRIAVRTAGHPLPDARGLAAASEAMALVRGLGREDVALVLLSGGASALWPLPVAELALADKQRVTEQLLRAGADIGELNAVRKHLSALKGGGLACAAAPAQVLSLVLSDVIGDRLDVIASGPTVADASTFAEARAVLERRGVWEASPASVRARLVAGAAGEREETAKPGDPRLARARSWIVASNATALAAAAEAARARGWNVWRLPAPVQGEARLAGAALAALARDVREGRGPVAAPACVLAGGETTVTVRGGGRGGRNQELALAAVLALHGLAGVVLLSGATDGVDGPTDAAGAIVSGATVTAAEARAHLEANDSYPLLARRGALLRTGPTGTNVMDLQIVLIA